MAVQKKTKRGTWQLFLQLVAVVLLSALLVGILATEIARTADGLQYEEAACTTVPLNLGKIGYIFYDATVVESIDAGPIDYRASSGDAVQAGDMLAVVYADGAGAGTRERGREIVAEIERLQALDGAIPPDYHTAYLALMQTLSQNSTQATAENVAVVNDALALFDAQDEEAGARAARIAALWVEF